MALLNAFCRAWVLGGLVLRRLVLKRLVAGLEVLMTSASELIFYTVLLTFWTKCREFAAKLARYFRNILENFIKFIKLKKTVGR
ncbi:hypothetical protein [Shewanella algae]|uniref:hypothetical protein n=1 Tax=Shewanella algae TaxID=38313 RepID=UPI001AAF6DCB|nr:hypothetical protein [Shewanella algae]EKT4489159.1 hypothetical protein [Shewanella algae]MBO2548211.1 hypothetical protein [Shewanella algae]